MLYSKLSYTDLGSSLTFSAQGGRGKEKNYKPAKKSFCRSEDGSAGGGWGEECRAVRAKSAKPRRLLGQSRAKQNTLFFLEEFFGGARKSESLIVERDTRIELASLAWEASVLPLYKSRISHCSRLLTNLGSSRRFASSAKPREILCARAPRCVVTAR